MVGKLGRLAIAVVLASSALLLARPTPARAHVSLVQAVPPAGAVLATAPARVDLLFSGPLEDHDSRLRVFDAQGRRVDRDDQQVSGQRMSIGVRDVPTGVYRVEWVAAGADEHQTRGSYTFQVGPPAAGAPRLLLSPSRTDAGQTITVRGEGFAPRALVLVTYGTDQQLLRPVTADEQGQFQFDTLVPLALAHGRQVFQALDTELRMAAAELWVERGGWPPLAVQVEAGAETHGHHHEAAPTGHEGHVVVQIRLVNQSNWHLRGVTVRATLPPGVRLLREGLEGPEGARWTFADGVLTWRGATAPPHTITGPFRFTVEAPGVRDPDALRPAVTVTFRHTTPPEFTGTATFEPEPPRP